MKLKKFSVTNYRSITRTSNIILQDFTVLVGKNNEGKSNLLKALQLAMDTLLYYGESEESIRYNRYFTRQLDYNWERDFPLHIKDKRRAKKSTFILEFELDNTEIDEFYNELKLRGNGIIPIEITYDYTNDAQIEVKKQHGGSYKKKSINIAKFISSRLKFNYIAAVRTEEMTMEVLKNIVGQRIFSARKSEKYLEALQTIEEIQSEVVDDIASELYPSLRRFLPNLNSVRIDFNTRRYINNNLSRNIKFFIDDGVETDLNYKGEGIKSLVALAILKDLKGFKGASIVAIEEPESHLHSEAIHSLVEVIHEISITSQVIITTHNPLFVQRNNMKSNVIVDSGKAHVAHGIEDVRDILGVMPEDNLQNTSNILLVEGHTDQIILRKILSSLSPKIKSSLNNNHFVIKHMGSASNLSHYLNEFNQSMCKVMVAIDNDCAGKEATEKAVNKHLISQENIKFIGGPGGNESELEDIIKPNFYKDLLLNEFHLNIDNQVFSSDFKWSKRLKSLALVEGTHLTEELKNQIKIAIANLIPDNITDLDSIFVDVKLNPIRSLAFSIERMID